MVCKIQNATIYEVNYIEKMKFKRDARLSISFFISNINLVDG